MHKQAETIISLDDVSLTLPGPDKKPLPILHTINLEVQTGDTVSITGSSGSGKTSLMMLIAGVEQATGGTLHVAGKNITSMNEDQLAAFRQEHVGIVFQNFHLIPTMSALDNVSLALEFAGFENTKTQAQKWLKEVGLAKRMDHYPHQLSGGEQQRVALARASATEPDLLLADEPTGNLDSENSHSIIKMLFDLREMHGSTLVLITHDKELAQQTSHQLVMHDGQLKTES